MGSRTVEFRRLVIPFSIRDNREMPSESEIIRMIRSRSRRRCGPGVEVGIGDDAAVLKPDLGTDLLFCSDLSVEDIHFRTQWATHELIGRKAMAATISDIAAMGGEPRFALASVALPRGWAMGLIEQLFSGMFGLADDLGFSLVGGDTTASPGPIFIDTSAIGVCGRGRAIRRNNARPGDHVYVTGDLGGSGLGLTLLGQGFKLVDDSRPLDQLNSARQAAIMRHLAPAPRVQAGRMLGFEGLATAMIDISDGLATDLGHIAEDSNCGAVIHGELIPLAQALKDLSSTGMEIDSVKMALQSGEEYELAFCSPADNVDRIRDLSETLELPITRIGEIIREPGLYIEQDGQTVSLDTRGFEHQI